ncbi:MAG TPA: hypothetical protein VLL54_22210 [Pyrinomonadaceae bacterium]|nr:hypothetical protein [Pyrinomonadaceae bacterium]
MAISRRFFIKSGTLTAVAASVFLKPQILALAQTAGNSLGFQIPLSAQRDPTYMFTSGTFEPYIGSFFQAPNARGEKVSLKLVSVNSYKPARATKISIAPSAETDTFSLMFNASGALPKFTSIHQVSHPALGTFDLFLSPHSLPGKERMYEAVFNHI